MKFRWVLTYCIYSKGSWNFRTMGLEEKTATGEWGGVRKETLHVKCFLGSIPSVTK
jgi:hypothetical protein